MMHEKDFGQDFDVVMNAIIDGHYSWACVILLRSMGYNPRDYMPSRTYNRLLKQHQTEASPQNYAQGAGIVNNHREKPQARHPKIIDLPYMETDCQPHRRIGGSTFMRKATTRFRRGFRRLLKSA